MINPNSFEDTLALLETGAVEVEPYQANTISLDQVEDVLNKTTPMTGKTVVAVNPNLK
ncbi:hypothetical protein [Fructilactobacillus sanfranciscensis]|nr:hypothetical protein [Fructilactobacillus sanfranciscensis]